MPLTNDKIAAIKNIAGDKDVIILIEGGHVVSGVLSEVTSEHIKLEAREETVFLTVDCIKALRIRL